jgi:site-specific recombinase XerD
VNIESAIKSCIDDLSLGEATALTYKKGLKTFREFLQTKGIETSSEIEVLSIDYFIKYLPWLDRRYSKGSVRVYGSAAKALLDWMFINGVLNLSYQDMARYKQAVPKSNQRHEYKLPRFPKRTDVPDMRKTVRLYEEESPIKERNIAMIEFLASTGCRNSEAVNLTVKDIDFTNRSTIVTGKGKKERRVWFSPEAAEALQTYWKERGSAMPTDPAFARHDKGAGSKRMKKLTPTTTRNIVKQIAIIAGIDPSKFSPHYFRHAFAIRVLSESGNLALVQDLLGHTDPKQTRVYAKIYSEDLQAAHHKIFG